MNPALAFGAAVVAMLAGAFGLTLLGIGDAPAPPVRDGEDGLRIAVVGSFTVLAVIFLLRRRHLM